MLKFCARTISNRGRAWEKALNPQAVLGKILLEIGRRQIYWNNPSTRGPTPPCALDAPCNLRRGIRFVLQRNIRLSVPPPTSPRGWNNIFPPPAMMSDELLWHCSRCQYKVFSDFWDDTDEVSAELCQNTRWATINNSFVDWNLPWAHLPCNLSLTTLGLVSKEPMQLINVGNFWHLDPQKALKAEII